MLRGPARPIRRPRIAAGPRPSRTGERRCGPKVGGKLYGTLSNVFRTATHVVCPICGKSSSLKSFPAGGGTDIVLQTFQGMGRGKGFSVISRESGIDDRELASALKPKLLELVSVLAAHGHITKSEIVDSVLGQAETVRIEVPGGSDPKTRELVAELEAEKRTREFLEDEITDLQNGMTKLLKQWREAERRDALAERKIDELRGHTERLVAVTREGVESLQKLRAKLKDADRGTSELADHVRKMKAVVEAVQGLRVPQKRSDASAAKTHDAR